MKVIYLKSRLYCLRDTKSHYFGQGNRFVTRRWCRLGGILDEELDSLFEKKNRNVWRNFFYLIDVSVLKVKFKKKSFDLGIATAEVRYVHAV